MSVLLPATIEVLKTVRPSEPFFSRILAELFDKAHTRGPFTILPYAEGGYLVFDTRADLGKSARGHYPTIETAHAALEALAASQAADERSDTSASSRAARSHGAGDSLSPAASGVARDVQETSKDLTDARR